MTKEKTSVKLCRAARAGIRYERETVKKNCSRYDVKKRTFRQFASLMSLGFASRAVHALFLHFVHKHFFNALFIPTIFCPI